MSHLRELMAPAKYVPSSPDITACSLQPVRIVLLSYICFCRGVEQQRFYYSVSKFHGSKLVFYLFLFFLIYPPFCFQRLKFRKEVIKKTASRV